MPGLRLRGLCPLLLQQQDQAPPQQQRVRQQAPAVLPALLKCGQALPGVLSCQLPACQGGREQPQPERCDSSGGSSSKAAESVSQAHTHIYPGGRNEEMQLLGYIKGHKQNRYVVCARALPAINRKAAPLDTLQEKSTASAPVNTRRQTRVDCPHSSTCPLVVPVVLERNQHVRTHL